MDKKNNYNKKLSIIFISFLAIMIFLNFLSKDKNFSELENRVLSKKPKFTFDRFFDGRYAKKYEKYKNDQFIARNNFMKVKSNIDLLIGKKDSNGVYRGKDGYLLDSFSPMNKSQIQKNTDAINNFSKKYDYIDTYITIIPNSISILKDKLPNFATVEDQEVYIENFYSSLDKNINTINTIDTLNAAKNNYIYYKTDHHWTSLGAYTAFSKIEKDMALSKSNIKYNSIQVSNNFNGTLSSKSGFNTSKTDDINVYLPTSESDLILNFLDEQKKTSSLYNTEKLLEKDKYALFLNGNHPILEIKTTSDTDKELLLIKDSYANSLVPFLTPHYSKIIMIDPRYYYDDLYKLIETNNFSDILFLYNANTFFSDTSLAPVLNNE